MREAVSWEMYFVSGIFCLGSNLSVWCVHKQRQKHCVQVEHGVGEHMGHPQT